MTVSRYANTVDLENSNTSHSLAVLSVPPNSNVLDLGVADGSVARVLRQRGCSVWGVDVDADAAEQARLVCTNVTVGDLEEQSTWAALAGQTFDAVLALDVLEHLRDPVAALARARALLTKDGIAIVSIPNITHAAVRASILRGQFRYTDLGLLDRTHLRFFDRQSAEELMTNAGLEILSRLRVRRSLEETEIPVRAADLPVGWLDSFERDPDATTYQFVFVARAGAQRDSVGPTTMLAERLQVENDNLLTMYTQLERYAKGLEAQASELRQSQVERDQEHREQAMEVESLRAEVVRLKIDFSAQAEQLTAAGQAEIAGVREELESELTRRIAELDQRHRELMHLHSDLAVKEAFIHSLRQDVRRLAAEASALKVYADSAAFRLAERLIKAVKRVPFLYRPLRYVVRQLAGRPS